MPIPVPVTPGPLPITDDVTARAEQWLAAFVRAVEYGTTGATLNTPPSTIDLRNTGTVVPVVLDTAERQLFFRQQMLALAQTLLHYATATNIGITRLSTDPSDPNFPTALNSEEVTTVPSPNKVPRARTDGTLDPGWITGTPGPGPAIVQTFTGTCLSGDAVGDLMYVSAPAKVVRKVDITDFTKTPAVGCIVSKPTATTCVVQTAGLVSSVYSGLTAGKIYVVGANSRPVIPLPVPAPSTTLFLQQIGIAVDTNLLLISPASQLTRIRG
jgi:hypothetical protein